MDQRAFQRARRPEQKEERKTLLLNTARRLLQEKQDSSMLSLNALARHAGMAKSNVYRYFESREAVLLGVLEGEWANFAQALVTELGEDDTATWSIERLGASLTSLLTDRPLLCHLMSVLPSTLEKNLSVETIRQFKLSSVTFLNNVAQLEAQRCPALEAKQHAELFSHLIVYLTGLYPYANPPEAVAKATDVPELELLRYDFEPRLLRQYLLLARGLQAEGEAKTR